MPVLATLTSPLPAAIGVIAACMAIGAFVRQAPSAIRGADEQELRRGAAIGGVVGLGCGLMVAFLSVTL